MRGVPATHPAWLGVDSGIQLLSAAIEVLPDEQREIATKALNDINRNLLYLKRRYASGRLVRTNRLDNEMELKADAVLRRLTTVPTENQLRVAQLRAEQLRARAKELREGEAASPPQGPPLKESP